MFSTRSVKTSVSVLALAGLSVGVGCVPGLLPGQTTPTPIPTATANAAATGTAFAVGTATAAAAATATATSAATATPSTTTLFSSGSFTGTGTTKATAVANFTTASYNLNNTAPLGAFTPKNTTGVITIVATGTAAAARPMIQVVNFSGTQTVNIFNTGATSATTTLKFVPADGNTYSLYVVDVGQAPNAAGTYTVTVTQ